MTHSRVFMVALDILDPAVSLPELKQMLKTDQSIKAWWNHIPGCFLISTELTPNDLTDKMKSVTHKARLLVMEVNPAVSEGWLPETSWRWIRKIETEKVS